MRKLTLLLVLSVVIGLFLGFPASMAGVSEGLPGGGEPGAMTSASQVLPQVGDPVIFGIARDDEGAAVSGVLVVAEDAGTHVEAASDTTDAAGSYSLALPAGTYDVKATPSSGGTVTYAGIALAGDVEMDIILVPTELVTFSGRLLDRDGDPIPNQSVYLKQDPFGKTGNTDDGGNFSIQVPPGEYSLEVISGLFFVPPNVPSSYQLAASGTVNLTQNTSMDITLNEVYLTGRVQNSSGAPVADTQLFISGSTTFGAFSGTFSSFATSDGAGNFSAVVFPSALDIEATPPDSSPYVKEKVQGLSVLSDGSTTITLDDAINFSGMLLDRDGDPVPNQTVHLKKADFTNSGNTTEAGNYSFKVVPGSYTLEITNSLFLGAPNAPASFELVKAGAVSLSGDTSMNLSLNEAYLTGTVVGPTGTPVPDVQLHISGSCAWGDLSGSFDSYANSDAAGNYSAVIFPSSSVTIEATPQDGSGYGYTKVEGLNIPGDQTRNVTLINAVTFSGQLQDRDGDPVPNQTIYLSRPPVAKMGGTDSGGNFSIGVAPGDYTLEVMSGFLLTSPNVPPSFGLTRSGDVSLNQNTSMNIGLSEAYLTGKVVDPTGNPIPDAQLHVSGNGTWGDLSGRFDSYATSDSGGNFNCVVFATAVDIEVTPPDGSGYGPSQITSLDATRDKSLFIVLSEVSDNTPPAAVDDLNVSVTYDESVTLQWIAPGDNGPYGQAAEYDIRYSTSPIDEGNWAAAAQCADEPSPKPSGQLDSFLVSGLTPTTTYYFALKTADEASNWSAISNIAEGTTQEYINLTVTSLTPNNAIQFSWWVDLEITGTGFQPGATVQLEMGEAIVEASSVNVVSENTITCSVLILAQSPGFYDVVVTNPGGKQARLLFAFSVGLSCGSGSGAGVLMLGLTLGLLSLAGSSGLRRRRKILRKRSR